MRVAKEYGKEFPDNLYIKILGTQEIDGATLVINTLKLNVTPQVFLDRVHVIEENEMAKVKCMHGEYYYVSTVLLCHRYYVLHDQTYLAYTNTRNDYGPLHIHILFLTFHYFRHFQLQFYNIIQNLDFCTFGFICLNFSRISNIKLVFVYNN